LQNCPGKAKGKEKSLLVPQLQLRSEKLTITALNHDVTPHVIASNNK